TRQAQLPPRGLAQGAHEALVLLETPDRYTAGIAEVALKEHISDKTNWRNMLKNTIQPADLFEVRDQLKKHIPEEAAEYFMDNGEKLELTFPVLEYPKKIKSLNFKKQTEYKGTLKGIKGQYLIFEDNTVFNVRSNSGFIANIGVN